MSDYIPEEILKWLPVKTLLQCRCVCKRWKEVIDSPLFVQQQLALQKSRLLVKYEEPHLLVLDPCTLPSVQTLSLPSSFAATLIDDEFQPSRLVGTLHGVVCLYGGLDNILIWNPSIRKFSIIPAPLPGVEIARNDNFKVKNLPYFGFWMDPFDKHYKIIMFKLVYGGDPYELVDGYLYSSIHQLWRSVPLNDLKDLKPCLSESPPVMIHGVAYWRANHYHTDHVKRIDYLDMVVLSYDFTSECFDTIMVPESIQYRVQFQPRLCSLQDSLAIVSLELKDTDNCQVHIWVDKTWIQIMAFEVYIAPVFSILWVLGETEETCRVVAECGEELVLYDTQNNLDLLTGQLENSTDVYMAYDFVESLLFP